MNATRPEAKAEYSTVATADPGGRAGAGIILAGLVAAVVGGLLAAQRTVALARRPVLVLSVTTGSHDGWTVVMLAAVALILAVGARRGSRSRAAFAGAFALGLCALFIAAVLDRSGIGRMGAVRLDGRLLDAEVRAGTGLYVTQVGAALTALGGLCGALLAGPGRHRAPVPVTRSRRPNGDATHRQQTRD